jgi:hypothetical protein
MRAFDRPRLLEECVCRGMDRKYRDRVLMEGVIYVFVTLYDLVYAEALRDTK